MSDQRELMAAMVEQHGLDEVARRFADDASAELPWEDRFAYFRDLFAAVSGEQP